MNPVILIIEDDIAFGTMLKGWFQRNKFTPVLCSGIEQAKNKIKDTKVDLVLTDLRLPDGDGIMFLQWIREQKMSMPVMIMTSYGEVTTAVKAIKLGAEDYLEKPINPAILKEKIDNIFMTACTCDVKEKTGYRKSKVIKDNMVIGKSASARHMHDMVMRVAPTKMSILILGESGTGKEYTARLIHNNSSRADKPFIAIDCGSLSKELAPSELFGHIKGSFTSAIANKTGVFEQAAGGTVFLDEVGNLSYEVQVQLLRALQEKKIRKVGAEKDTDIDVRILAATNENLEKAIAEGRFREDLYHRLNEFTLPIPPLRECKEDIELYAMSFLKDANEELERNITGFSLEAVSVLKEQYWSGNLRELRNVVRRAVLFANGNSIEPADFPVFSGAPAPQDYSLYPHNEKEQIENVLRKARGNKTLAAQLLKIDRKTLYNKMHLYGIEL